MRRFRYVVALCATISLIGVATATAASVTTGPGGAATATATAPGSLILGGTARGPIGTLGGSGGGGLGCAMVMTLSSSASGASFPLAIAPATTLASPLDSTQGNVDFRCPSCRLGAFVCRLTCDGRANLVVTAPTSGGVTAMRITGFRCVFSISPSCTVTVASIAGPTVPGGMNATYTNLTSTLSILPTGQNLWGTASTCATLPNGQAQLTGPSGGNWDFVFSPAQTITAV